MKKIKAVALVVLIVASLVIIPTQANARLDEEGKYGSLAKSHNRVTGQTQGGETGIIVISGIVLGILALGIAFWLIRRKRA